MTSESKNGGKHKTRRGKHDPPHRQPDSFSPQLRCAEARRGFWLRGWCMTDWQTILAIDSDRWACETYRNAWPEAIASVQPRRERKQPRMFLFENEPGMLTENHLAYTRSVYEALTLAGYVVEVEEFDAVNFGVPQFRKRVWWWGIRRDLFDAGMRHCWPKPTHAWPWPETSMFSCELDRAVTVGWALDIPHMQKDGTWFEGDGVSRELELQAHGNNKGGKHDIASPGPTMRSGSVPGCSDAQVHEYRWSDEMHRKHPPASPASPAPSVLGKWYKGGAEGLVKVDPKHPCNVPDKPGITQRSGGRGHSGPSGPDSVTDGVHVRRLTPQECARLQSCPDDMRWPDGISKTQQYKIIGNGWACGMAAAMSRALKQSDPESHTVIDEFCGGGLGSLGWHGRYWSYELSQDGGEG